jgi:spermidine/putrescine transport system permease protein
MKPSHICLIITICVLIFLYLPILMLVISSFNESRFGGLGSSFTFKWYIRLFQEKEMWIALRNSLIIGISATLTSTFLGTLAAFALHFCKNFIIALSIFH